MIEMEPLPLPHEKFLDAVRNGDKIELERLLDIGKVNVNSFDREGQTALHLCCLEGKLDLVKLLVKFGADVRLANRDGWTAMHIAACGGHRDITLYLFNALKT